ncbi:MAG TPA: PQQ-binding-like beta-propeller repeat protein [Planctomycetota bacterium]|nr:PQQ-binding-like beta-propeller repeat protein [Planctomycetota bacterium]
MTKTNTLGMTGVLVSLLALPIMAAGPAPDSDWNQWKGPKRDGLSPDTGLLKEWPTGGPPLAWKATGIGTGFSSVSVHGGKIYTMGEAGNAFNLVALSAADGKVLWTTKIADLPEKAVKNERDYPGPRGTPCTDGSLVITLAPYGDLLCADASTGKEKWRKQAGRDFGAGGRSDWMYAESPLLDGDTVVFSPGGSKGTVAALKKETGEPIWQSADLTDAACYSSLVPAEIGGKKQYLILTASHVAGIESATGKVLWKIERKGKVAVIPDPVYKDDIVFVSSGYGLGCNAYKISGGADGWKAEEIYSGPQIINHHGGVLLVGDHLYELDDKNKLKCADIKTGKIAWEEPSVGKGSIAYADGHLIVRSEKNPGTIALVDASPEGYKERGRFNPPDASKKQIWPHPVIIGGKMYIRDQDVLLCYDVKAK